MSLLQELSLGRGPAPGVLAGALAIALLGLAGCVLQQEVAARVTTADGQVVDLPLTTIPTPISDGVVTVQSLQIAPWDIDKEKGKAKTLAFTFVVQFAEGSKPTVITIEDVSEAPILPIFEDKGPKIVKNNLWGAVSSPISPHDAHVNWLLTLDNSIRVYRFTVKLADGTKHVLYKAIFLSAGMKNYIRSILENV
jgi:hypothetical protein